MLWGCADGSLPEQAPTIVSDSGSEVLDAGSPPPFQQDHTCDPIPHGPVCRDYLNHNPDCPWPLVQYSILCDAGTLTWQDNHCVVWSFDPYQYSGDSWAYCCELREAGAVR